MPMPGGAIEVVCGPMFSGKTEELIRRVRRAQIARQTVQIFKPGIDNRYHESDVVSHSSLSMNATPIRDAVEILQRLLDSTRVVAIDEAQFFDRTLVAVVEKLARRGIRVILAGLDQDSNGRPFGPMPELLAIADFIQKIPAICTVCGANATKSFRRPGNQDGQVLVGEADIYEARCRAHFDVEAIDDQMPLFTVAIHAQESNSSATE